MYDESQNDLLDESPPGREGFYDEQLLFETAFVEPPKTIRTILKRDGRAVPYDQRKIAETILKAAEPVENLDADRAASLARGVTLYLHRTLDGEPPSVDQVHDAVEKVLLEMGHTETALAYVRYRDRRARIRRLRQGDTRALLGELAEAQHGRALAETFGPAPLFVRTSAETLAEWNRDRIAAALVRETGLEETTAGIIAVEVENQLRAAQVRTLTTPLIRELVSAKLIEHGLEEHGRRHRRLGVPLYDAAAIICGPHSGQTPLDPLATDLVLAESVKREFALAEVFSRDVADAHLRGDIHVHDLGFVDRLHRCVQSLESVKRFGLGFSGTGSASHPPRHPATLLAQMIHLNTALQSHFAGPIGWDAINVFFAPFLTGLDDKELHQMAQMIVFEYAHRALAHGDRVQPTELGIYWEVPPHLRNAVAVGPGGEYTGRFYADLAHTVQQFAWALVDVFTEGGARGVSFPAPVPLIHITPGFFKAPGAEAFLDHVAALAARRGNVHVLFDRHEIEGADPEEVWQPRYTVVQAVTINLPRLAYRAHNEHALLDELARVARVVVQAHRDKHTFITRLLALKGVGPLALLAAERDGMSFLNLDHALYVVGVTGMNECVRALSGDELHTSEKAAALACRIAEHLSNCFGEHSEIEDLNFVLAQTTDLAIARRFATLDLHTCPDKAAAIVKTDARGQSMCYSPGAQLSADYDGNPIERVRLEGQLHDWLRDDAHTPVRMPDDETSKESIAAFIRKAYYQTQTHRIVFQGADAGQTR